MCVTRYFFSIDSDFINNSDDNKKILPLFIHNKFTKLYANFKDDRYDIYRDHKGKVSGVYLLYNKISGHYYVGSSISIANRMRTYLKLSYIKGKDRNMPILKGLLKYGYNNFSLIIIEYVNNSNLGIRETYWINYLKPYYNILQQAYSSSDFTHSEYTKNLLRIRAKGRVHTEKTKTLISQSLKGFRNPFFNRKHSKLSKEKISTKNSKGLIYVYDDMLRLLVEFTSLTDFKNTIKANMVTLNKCLGSNTLSRGGWYIRSSLLYKDDKPLISDKSSSDFIKLINIIQDSAHIKQAIFVFDSNTKKFLRKFNGIIEAEKILCIRHEKIKYSIKNNQILDDYLFSYHRLLSLPF